MRLILLAAAAAAIPLAAGAAAAKRPAVQHYPPDKAVQSAARAGGFKLPFSSAVRVGDILYLSGVIGTGDDGARASGMEAQARRAMDNIGAMLKRAGRSFDDVFKCTVTVDDMRDWQAFNLVYMTYFKPDRLPARSAFGADGLALGALVEVECLAHAPER